MTPHGCTPLIPPTLPFPPSAPRSFALSHITLPSLLRSPPSSSCQAFPIPSFSFHTAIPDAPTFPRLATPRAIFPAWVIFLGDARNESFVFRPSCRLHPLPEPADARRCGLEEQLTPFLLIVDYYYKYIEYWHCPCLSLDVSKEERIEKKRKERKDNGGM